MSDLKICRICLRTETKVYNYDKYQLKCYYEEVMALKVYDNDKLPQYFCYECATMLHRFHKFKEKCHIGQKALKEMLWVGPLSYEQVYKLDRTKYDLKSKLELTKLMPVDIKTEDTRIEQTDYSDIWDESEDSISDCEQNDQSANVTLIENDGINDDDNIDSQTVYVEIKTENEIKEGIERKKHYINSLDERYWKKWMLTEEQAANELRSKAEDSKYLAAEYKCTDCFKWFSKKDMLKRHLLRRHSESVGQHQCHLCRMRFKLACYLRKHMRDHYYRFQCLRCDRYCPLENSALLHEQFHSGVTKKCMHCNEEFRLSSTYYTHLRTHRSEHVCEVCGASFVSQAGLHMHKRLKHVAEDLESPDDDEAVNTYCERCQIRFETRKAYEEHLFHSAMHTESEYDEILASRVGTSRKVLGKRDKEKITKRLFKKRSDEFATTPQEGKNKRTRKNKIKPTTCHQCGKHFATQAACLKHHVTEHPGTSFFSPAERHICEICGASLAPGSVAVHQNMHTKEKVHSCNICDKQFYASVGLKRHLLTHTGEKPFACKLCDKRFTQSNSMKLHYRTFHLKQPYPKRNRRKKNEAQECNEEDSTEDSDSLPEVEENCIAPSNGIEIVPSADMPSDDENVLYLNLG